MSIFRKIDLPILAINTRSVASSSSTRSSQTKKSSSAKLRKRSASHKGSSADESTPAVRRERPGRAKTRDEIYALYCAFGEKKQPGQDFLSHVANVLRDSIEGLLTHAEVNHSLTLKTSSDLFSIALLQRERRTTSNASSSITG